MIDTNEENFPVKDMKANGAAQPSPENAPSSGESKFESLVKRGQIPAGQVLLETKGLVKAYHGRKVVNDVNLTVKSGEIVGLL